MQTRPLAMARSYPHHPSGCAVAPTDGDRVHVLSGLLPTRDWHWQASLKHGPHAADSLLWTGVDRHRSHKRFHHVRLQGECKRRSAGRRDNKRKHGDASCRKNWSRNRKERNTKKPSTARSRADAWRGLSHATDALPLESFLGAAGSCTGKNILNNAELKTPIPEHAQACPPSLLDSESFFSALVSNPVPCCRALFPALSLPMPVPMPTASLLSSLHPPNPPCNVMNVIHAPSNSILLLLFRETHSGIDQNTTFGLWKTESNMSASSECLPACYETSSMP